MELSKAERNQLRLLMGNTFDDSDVSDLCFELDIDYDDLPGKAKKDKIRELILHCEKLGLLDELLAACRRQRPHVPWPGVGAAEPPPPAPPPPSAPAPGVNISGTANIGGDVVGGNKITYSG